MLNQREIDFCSIVPQTVAPGTVFGKGMDVWVIPIAGDGDFFFPQGFDAHIAAGGAADMQ